MVVVVALRRFDAYQRQRALAEDADRQLDAGDELLDDDQVVVLGGGAIRDRHFVVVDLGDLA